jgi:predicted transglutaminase-like cysteine proteinase
MLFRKYAQDIDRRAFLVNGAVAAAGSLLGAGEARATGAPSIFNSTEKRKEGLKPFPKWRGALDKYFEERKDEPGSCSDLSFNRCHYVEWFTELERVKGKNAKTQLKEINRFMNGHKYIVDPINYGVQDYWASPGEFFHRHGDCEDFSIAKFLSLRALDTPLDDMRVFIVDDLNLRIGHAVLAAYLGGKVLILDNQLSIVVEARRIRHYKPIYSLNETGWWRHRPQA